MNEPESRVRLDPTDGLWERFFMVAPLVLIGTRDADGHYDLAPKHMVTALSWTEHIGFVCIPRHATYQNAVRERCFTVSFPTVDQVLQASLASAPRCDDHEKHALEALPTSPATQVDGVLLCGAYLHMECALDRVIDGFGENSLISGRILTASVTEDALREGDRDDADLLQRLPLLAYLHPGRFARIDQTFSFPYHEGFTR